MVRRRLSARQTRSVKAGEGSISAMMSPTEKRKSALANRGRDEGGKRAKGPRAGGSGKS